MLHLREDSNDKAQQRLQQAADVYRQLTERFPSVSLYQIALARTLSESAEVWRRMGDLPSARGQSDAAVETAQKCETLRGDDRMFQSFLERLEQQRDLLASAPADIGDERLPPPPPVAVP